MDLFEEYLHDTGQTKSDYFRKVTENFAVGLGEFLSKWPNMNGFPVISSVSDDKRNLFVTIIKNINPHINNAYFDITQKEGEVTAVLGVGNYDFDGSKKPPLPSVPVPTNLASSDKKFEPLFVITEATDLEQVFNFLKQNHFFKDKEVLDSAQDEKDHAEYVDTVKTIAGNILKFLSGKDRDVSGGITRFLGTGQSPREL